MRKSQRGAFTPEERKAAIWALLMAILIAVLAMTLQQWMQPSLGPWGGDQAATSIPDVLDAQPVA